MNNLLKPGQVLYTDTSNIRCQVKDFIGSGTQGEVYRAEIGGKEMALKWYLPKYLSFDHRLRERLQNAINIGSPSEKFMWPIELVSVEDITGFGYIMELRENRFKGIDDMMVRRIEPSFRAVVTAGFELAHSYLRLHSNGLCYRDISFGNVFLDPSNGDVRICDNDNVDVDKQPGFINGTPMFMAPELVRGEKLPSIQSDLYSLAILLFYMLMVHHPLNGAKEAAIHCLDEHAMRTIYGYEPVFIFDPNDQSNAPVPGRHNNAIIFWKIYPQFIRDLFIRSFTDGIRDPEHGRVRENTWRAAMIQLRDWIIYCSSCGAQNFYDQELLQVSGAEALVCWSCKHGLKVPPRMRISTNATVSTIIMLNYDSKLFPHHIDNSRLYDFSHPVAEIVQNLEDTNIWGLRNIGNEKWVGTNADGKVYDIAPSKTISLMDNLTINFGTSAGEMKL